MSIKMVGSNIGPVVARSGTRYVPDTAGVVSVALADLADLQAAGYRRVSLESDALTPATNSITAHAAGGQASAVVLTSVINRVTTVATADDSVKLPAAVAGLQVVVINAAASNSMNVFPASGEAINALTADTAFAVAANKTAIFNCAVDGTWNSVLTA